MKKLKPSMTYMKEVIETCRSITEPLEDTTQAMLDTYIRLTDYMIQLTIDESAKKEKFVPEHLQTSVSIVDTIMMGYEYGVCSEELHTMATRIQEAQKAAIIKDEAIFNYNLRKRV